MKNIANADRPKSVGAMLPPRPLRRSGKVAQTACNSDRREGKSCIPTLNQTFADSRILKISKFRTFRIAGFLRALEDTNETFVADVHRTQRVWTEEPGLHVPAPKPGRGRPSKKREAATKSITVEKLAKGIPAEDWTRCFLRNCTRGQLRVDITHRRVWLWNGKEEQPRCWHLIIRREVGSVKTIKYSLSNAPADTPRLQLAQMQGQRYWVERAFEDGKGECGLADYQALGWRSWHHHVTMVMLAMLFILEQRVAQQPGLELLTPRDIVEMLKETLPRKPEGREALVARINERHERRRGAIESRFRTQHRRDSG